MTTYLDRILDAHRSAARERTEPVDRAVERCAGLEQPRSFAGALRRAADIGVISEIKRRSPSKGVLRADLDPATLAGVYESAGASCLSVLTDGEFFGGSVADLQAARAAVTLPVLRKDFTVGAHDVVDTRLMGADCVLLIAAALDPVELRDLHALALEVGLDVLIEIHDERELEAALEAGAQMIGVNQRDLVTFEVDQDRAVRVAAAIPDEVIKVAESGIGSSADVERLRTAGYHAMLIGETLVTAEDPAAMLSALLG